jgi:hypothetical protein
MTKNFKQCLVIVPVMFLLLAGCATTNGKATESEGPKYTGFLSDYSKLEPDTDGSKAMHYINPQADMKKYKKFLLERIIVWLKDDADYKGIDPDVMKAMTDYFHEAIVRELGSDYTLVTEPGPDVLRVRIAVTDLVPTKPAMSVIVLAVPFASAADIASGAASKGGAGSPPYLGRAGVEVEGIDSETLLPVFSYVEERRGKKYDVEDPAGGYLKGFSEWGHVKKAFDYWAKKFRGRMDEMHGVAPRKES